MPHVISTSPDVIDAVTGQRLHAWTRETCTANEAVATQARTACERIGGQNASDAAEVLAWLSERGHKATIADAGRPRQRHDLELRVESFDAADSIADALGTIGFERWERWSGAAARSFRRHTDQITVARTRDHSFVLRIRWGTPPAPSRLTRALRPTQGDWDMVDLPAPLWRAYSLVRPMRLVLERLGRRDPNESGLGPFLSTPESLSAPLFELADLGPSDVFVDIGCGDGRLATLATLVTGCRSIGIEQDAELVRRGRVSIAEQGLSDLVTLRHGDARGVDLTEATVVFVFLPMHVMPGLVADILPDLQPGARVISHEQTPAATDLNPDQTTAIIADDAITVAHRWNA